MYKIQVWATPVSGIPITEMLATVVRPRPACYDQRYSAARPFVKFGLRNKQLFRRISHDGQIPIMDISTLPFNHMIGIVADGQLVRLVPTREHLNHVETVHAAVLYSVAEAASGQCLIKRLPHLVDSHVALLRTSTVKYRRQASLESDIRGAGRVSDDDVARFEAALQTRGRATIEIDVSVTQDETELFTGVFCWFVTRR